VRNVETLSGSVLAVLQRGRPTVRGAEVPGGKGCLKKRMPAAERQRESAAGDRFFLRWPRITGRIPGQVPGPVRVPT
jgi:hypothetical protein